MHAVREGRPVGRRDPAPDQRDLGHPTPAAGDAARDRGRRLMQGTDGKLYVAGASGFIYAIDAGLPPPAPSVVGFRPASGLVGTNVVVSGANYVGATGVTFNGVSAGFVVNASGVITATVPVGASSGPVQVTTPGGPVASQTDFTVLP